MDSGDKRKLAGEIRSARDREIKRLHGEGWSLRQLSEAFGLSHTRIWSIVRDLGEGAP